MHEKRTPIEADAWHAWLLRERYGDDPVYAAALWPALVEIRDRVLDNANLREGAVVADIGTGDGLVAFGALERHAGLEMLFVDISPALVDHVTNIAMQRGFADSSRFIVASVERLDAIADRSVDCITVRAVFAYVADKVAALRECFRILRPGGRISIVDPIFQDRAYALAGLATQCQPDATDPALRYIGYVHRIGCSHLPDTIDAIRRNPLTNYNERDLFRYFETAGFVDVHVRLHIDGGYVAPLPWDVFLRTSPRAGVATIGEVLATRFSAAERDEYEQLIRNTVEAGTMPERVVNAYVYADRP